jgi:hypothetical protein
MKSFLGYQADGALCSIETFHGGWPDCSCRSPTVLEPNEPPEPARDPNCGGLADPNCTDERVVAVRTGEATHAPTVIGWVAVVCACPADAGTCACASKAVDVNRLVDGALVAKAEAKIFLDGEEVEANSTVDRTPGTVLKLKLVAMDAPEGVTVRCSTRGGFDITKDPEFSLAFLGGETPGVTVVVPAQGGKSIFGFGGGHVRGARFTLRGWAE